MKVSELERSEAKWLRETEKISERQTLAPLVLLAEGILVTLLLRNFFSICRPSARP